MSAPDAPVSAPASPPAAARPSPPPWRLVATLSISGALAGFLLVFVYQVTQPLILAHKAEVLRAAVGEVLKAPARYEQLYVVGGELVQALPPGVEAGSSESVYLGFDEADQPVGFAIPGVGKGYADDIRLIFGYDPRSRKVLGLKVLENKETPGLGDAIEKDPAFYGQFEGKQHPVQGVKQGESGGDAHKVDMITGATISSRAVIGIVQGALDRLDPILRAHLEAKPR